MFDGDKDHGERVSREGRGGYNSHRVSRHSFTEKVTCEPGGMSDKPSDNLEEEPPRLRGYRYKGQVWDWAWHV